MQYYFVTSLKAEGVVEEKMESILLQPSSQKLVCSLLCQEDIVKRHCDEAETRGRAQTDWKRSSVLLGSGGRKAETEHVADIFRIFRHVVYFLEDAIAVEPYNVVEPQVQLVKTFENGDQRKEIFVHVL